MESLYGTTASRVIENPTKDRIQQVKNHFLSNGYTYVGDMDTSMHLESSNSYMTSTPSVTLYFEYL